MLRKHTTVEKFESGPYQTPRYVGTADMGAGQLIQIGAGRKRGLNCILAATSEGWMATKILWVIEGE